QTQILKEIITSESLSITNAEFDLQCANKEALVSIAHTIGFISAAMIISQNIGKRKQLMQLLQMDHEMHLLILRLMRLEDYKGKYIDAANAKNKQENAELSAFLDTVKDDEDAEEKSAPAAA